MSAAARKPAQENRGRFKPGPDPRRHKITREECSDGFWATIESVASRYPNAVINDGSHRHITVNFMKWATGHKMVIN